MKESNTHNVQNNIFRKMSAEKKVKLTSQLAHFCLKLNNLNDKNSSREITEKDQSTS